MVYHGLPNLKMVIFHGYVSHNQMVNIILLSVWTCISRDQRGNVGFAAATTHLILIIGELNHPDLPK